jgi:hypothetical protein
VPAATLPLGLAPGQQTRLELGLMAPTVAGAWTLGVDIANLTAGALSSTGRDLPTASVVVDPVTLTAEP